MKTVSEAELTQKASDFIAFVRDYMLSSDKDFVLNDKREGFKLSIYDKDVTLEFSL